MFYRLTVLICLFAFLAAGALSCKRAVVFSLNSEMDSATDGDADTDGDTDVDTDTDADVDTDTDADTDADADVECDGESLDCFSNCWECGLQTICETTMDSCLSDGECQYYFLCISNICCDVNNHCLTGQEWEDCQSQCAADNETSGEAIDLYTDIEACIACDACPISCGEKESAIFAMCTGIPNMNTPTSPCYQIDAADGETGCFLWAAYGGPCSEQTAACRENDDCVLLEECINDSWAYDDWDIRQEICLDEFYVVQNLYWAYQQCIYCDACDLACAADASFKKCSEYNNQ